MKYIRPTPNPSGAYPGPQSNPAPGLVPISDTLAAELTAYNGFVTLTIGDGEVTAVTPNTEAWEAWKAEEAAKPAPEEETELSVWDELAAAYEEGVNSIDQ